MRRLLVTALVLALAPGLLRAQKKPEGLWYYVDREDAWADVQKHIGQIDVLAPDVFGVDSLGVVWGELDPRVLALARAHRVALLVERLEGAARERAGDLQPDGVGADVDGGDDGGARGLHGRSLAATARGLHRARADARRSPSGAQVTRW